MNRFNRHFEPWKKDIGSLYDHAFRRQRRRNLSVLTDAQIHRSRESKLVALARLRAKKIKVSGLNSWKSSLQNAEEVIRSAPEAAKPARSAMRHFPTLGDAFVAISKGIKLRNEPREAKKDTHYPEENLQTKVEDPKNLMQELRIAQEELFLQDMQEETEIYS